MNHRLPEFHNCSNLGAFSSDRFRKLKTTKTDKITNLKGKSISYIEDFEKISGKHEINEDMASIMNSDPDVISFGKERVDLLVGLALIVFASSFFQIVVGWYSYVDVLILAFLIGPAFILHELAHKYMAIYFGKTARFLLRKRMTVGTLIMGLIPFGIAGPGIATIFDYSDEREMGIFSFAGPLVNLILSFIYLVIYSIFENNLNPYASIFALGVRLNIFLGMFNLLPFGPLDGLKIYNWSRPMWVIITFSFGAQFYISGTVI